MSHPPSTSRMNAGLVVATALFAMSRGVSMDEIAAATGVTADDLMGSPDWLPSDVVPRIWLLLAARAPGEAIALEMAKLAPVNRVFGELGRYVRLAPDLRSLLRTFVQNVALLSDELQAKLVEVDGEVRVCWSHPMDTVDGGYGAELGAGVGARSVTAMLEDPALLRRVDLRHQPLGPRDAYQAFFGVPVFFGCAENALVFHAGDLDRPNPHGDPGLQLFVQRHFDRVAHELGARASSPLLRRVRDAVAENAARGQFGSAALARRLGVSQRVLQRQLHDEGSSPRDLLDEAREAHAWELLRSPSLSVEEIAFLLGYSNERSFRRAFERWTGQSPATARREQT